MTINIVLDSLFYVRNVSNDRKTRGPLESRYPRPSPNNLIYNDIGDRHDEENKKDRSMSMVNNLLLNWGNYAGDEHVDCNGSGYSDCNLEKDNVSPRIVAVPGAVPYLIDTLDVMVFLRILEEAYLISDIYPASPHNASGCGTLWG